MSVTEPIYIYRTCRIEHLLWRWVMIDRIQRMMCAVKPTHYKEISIAFIMEIPIKMDDLGVPSFVETPICLEMSRMDV